MSVVRMKEAQGPQSGGGMDKEVASRRLSPKAKIGLGAGGLVLLLALFWYFMPAGNSQPLSALKNNLKAVAKNVVWLNLSHNNYTDASLDFLPSMTNLEKLRLEKNPVTDDIFNQLKGLHHLEALNLNETHITAAGLEKLKSMPNLKRVYSWDGTAHQ